MRPSLALLLLAALALDAPRAQAGRGALRQPKPQAQRSQDGTLSVKVGARQERGLFGRKVVSITHSTELKADRRGARVVTGSATADGDSRGSSAAFDGRATTHTTSHNDQETRTVLPSAAGQPSRPPARRRWWQVRRPAPAANPNEVATTQRATYGLTRVTLTETQTGDGVRTDLVGGKRLLRPRDRRTRATTFESPDRVVSNGTYVKGKRVRGRDELIVDRTEGVATAETESFGRSGKLTRRDVIEQHGNGTKLDETRKRRWIRGGYVTRTRITAKRTDGVEGDSVVDRKVVQTRNGKVRERVRGEVNGVKIGNRLTGRDRDGLKIKVYENQGAGELAPTLEIEDATGENRLLAADGQIFAAERIGAGGAEDGGAARPGSGPPAATRPRGAPRPLRPRTLIERRIQQGGEDADLTQTEINQAIRLSRSTRPNVPTGVVRAALTAVVEARQRGEPGAAASIFRLRLGLPGP